MLRGKLLPLRQVTNALYVNECTLQCTHHRPCPTIWEGRQKLPDDYYKEFLRVPYAAVTIFTLGAYFAHPIMQSASFYLGW